MSVDLINTFPFESLRKGQKEVLEQISAALDSDKKFIIAQLSTGTGKSPLALAAARSLGSAYILTVNKMLQDQYLRDFDLHMSDLRGRENYKCNKYAGFNCKNAPCQINEALKDACGNINDKKRACDYHVALDVAAGSSIVSMNFAAAYAFLNYTKFFNEKALMVIDEGHLIEDTLTRMIELKLSDQELTEMDLLPKTEKIPDFDEPALYVQWLMDLQVKVIKKNNARKINNLDGNDEDKYQAMQRKIGTILSILQTNSNNIVSEVFKEEEIPGDPTVVKSVIFRPIQVGQFAQEKLYKFGQKVLILSATIVDFESFMASVGIDPKDAVCIDAPSLFPAKNRPIIKNYVGTLNAKNIDSLMPSIVSELSTIMDNHHDEKGMIHTHSYKNAKYIYEALKKKYPNRVLFPESSKQHASVMAQHVNSTLPTVIISPSMTEGVDLKDDLARWQAITKMPYPYMGDKVVQARMKNNASWYAWRTALTVIQAYGRSTRSDTDHSVTYILDGAFDSILTRMKNSLPKSFLEAII